MRTVQCTCRLKVYVTITELGEVLMYEYLNKDYLNNEKLNVQYFWNLIKSFKKILFTLLIFFPPFRNVIKIISTKKNNKRYLNFGTFNAVFKKRRSTDTFPSVIRLRMYCEWMWMYCVQYGLLILNISSEDTILLQMIIKYLQWFSFDNMFRFVWHASYMWKKNTSD